jgi:AraC-like DNA-binding protein
MPWKARVTYRTGPAQAMVLCSCHIVPDFRPLSADFEYAVAFRHEERERFSGAMEDAPLPGLEGVRTSYLSREDPLCQLTNYIASRYDHGAPEEWHARELARLLMAELRDHFSHAERRQELSLLLRQALDFVDANYARPISTRDIARYLACSTSTITRHFRRELKQTPVGWINGKRINRACRLLATSTRHIGQIARMVGVEDRYYFSKLFRRHRGVTPSEYRQRNMIF